MSINENMSTDQLLKIVNALLEPEDTPQKNELLHCLLGRMGNNVKIRLPFYCRDGKRIFIEDSVFINKYCHFLDCGDIRIGKSSMIGPDVKMYTINHRHSGKPVQYKFEEKQIVIGKRCWIGGAAILLPGIEIGDEAIIGAGSVVSRSIPSRSVAVGNPCRVIKRF